MIAQVAVVQALPPSPLDISAWKERRQQRPEPTPAVTSNQGTETEWVVWFNRVAMNELPNPVLIAPQSPPKRPMPGTPEQQSQYIHQFSDRNHPLLTACVRAMRYKSVYGVYPDGGKTAPELPPGLSQDKLKWLLGQNNPCTYLKWFRKADPVAHAEYVRDLPGFRNLPAAAIETIRGDA